MLKFKSCKLVVIQALQFAIAKWSKEKVFYEVEVNFLLVYFGRTMKNTYCLFQIKFITEDTNVQHVIITQI